ncbi:MAG: hypothetical protein MI746_15900 [Pseudomonadales bacterium]|nr:hypothetical protein [Pseudomonadales bacterium]
MRVKAFLVALICALSCAANVSAQQDSYLRFIDGEEEWQGELQTSITSYRNEVGQTVELIAAIHIGDNKYYEQLNQYFLDLDVLLYELVGDEEQLQNSRNSSAGSSLSLVQNLLANYLGLEFQLAAIDYRANNFRHADLSAQELQNIMASKEESFFSMFMSMAMALLAAEQQAIASNSVQPSTLSMMSLITALSADNQSQALKYLLAQELGRTGGLVLSAEIESELTILGDRNRVALEVLTEALASEGEHIGLFYGAAHVPGLARALVNEMGFQRVDQRWLTAWQISP